LFAVEADIWARVSTDEQDTGNRLADLRAWADRRGLDVAREYILDGASAWTGEHRAQRVEALADARTGRYDVLLVWTLEAMTSVSARHHGPFPPRITTAASL
jgi:DNA invertase Pin-like site-specific DNA recombinase